MNLVFVRHGQSLWNLENRFTGWVDIDLSERGVLEAKEAGKVLKEAKFIPEYCFTSCLIRSIHTSQLILDSFIESETNNIQIKKLWQLNERHYGALQGLDKKETAKKYGEKQVQLWRRGYDIKPPLIDSGDKYDPNFDEMYSEVNELLPIGESLKDVVQRIKDTFEELIAYSVSKKVLVVAHGNSIRAMVKLLDNLSDEEIVDVNIPTGIPLAYRISDNEIEKIGYLGDSNKIEELQKEVELQSKLSKEDR